MLTLAVPVVMAELGWMAMGLVDTVMVGRIGPEAIGAVGIGSSLFMAICIFAMGLLLGLDTLVAHAFGAGRLDECHRWLAYGVALSLLLSIPITVVILALSSSLSGWGLDPVVLSLTQPYLDVLAWSIPPLLLYASFRRYLQGMGVVRPVMMALVFANILNAVVNWILIFGHLGAPAMGVRGSAWATVVARIVMAAVLLVVIVYRERAPVRSRMSAVRPPRAGGSWSPSISSIDLAPMRTLLALGLPAASQVTLEVGVFAAATALAGRLAPAALAAHQIAVNLASLTFMVPLGIASAGAVRVGHAVGRRDWEGAARYGWTANLFGVLLMSCAAAAAGSSSNSSPRSPASLDRRVHQGSGGRRDRGLAPLCGRAFSAVRRRAGCLHRDVARPRRHTNADALEPCRSLVHWPAAGIHAVLRPGFWCDRALVGTIDRLDHLRDRAGERLVAQRCRASDAVSYVILRAYFVAT